MNPKKTTLMAALSILVISQPAFAGFFDLFNKEPVPIIFKVDLSRKGTVLESNLKIKKNVLMIFI